MIYVSRIDGSQFVVNADLIETVEHTADTVLHLVDGKRLVVATPVEEIVERVIAFRQRIARGPLRIVDVPEQPIGQEGLPSMRAPLPLRGGQEGAHDE